MELKYHLTRAEYQHMATTQWHKIPTARTRLAFLQAALAALVFFAVWLLNDGIGLALTAAFVIATVFPPLVRLRVQTAFGKAYDLLKRTDDTTVRLDERGVSIARPHIRSEVDWEAFTSVTEDELGFYLTYAPLQSIFVPRRVFATVDEANSFWMLAQSYWQHARVPSAGPLRVP